MGPITNRTVLGNLGHIFLESNLMLNELRKIRKTTLIFFYLFLMRNNTNFEMEDDLIKEITKLKLINNNILFENGT
jgi:hypothetical protein